MKAKKSIILMLLIVALSASSLAAVNETGDTTLTIVSTTPTVATIELNDATPSDNDIVLTASTTTILECWGTATDPDGLSDIETVHGEIFSTTSAYGAADHDDRHYTNASCDYTVGTGAYNCSFPDVQYYAENDTWECQINVTDYAGNDNFSTDTATLNQLVALDIPDATEVDFGSIGVGQVSAEQSVTVENEGNVPIDFDVDVYRDDNTTADTEAMNCTTGLIPAANINASLTSGSAYSVMEGATILNLDATLVDATGNDQVPTTDIVYLLLEVPGSGVAGTCDGTIYFGAVLG